jgi:prepilin-type N-terminal cleavage/methylation domain-containing protein
MNFNFLRHKQGFSLVELLVTTSIVSILASLSMANVAAFREASMYAAAKVEMMQIRTVVIAAQTNSTQRLAGITGSEYSVGSCFGSSDLSAIPDSHGCYQRALLSFQRIATAAGMPGALDGMIRDPWGAPWLLDENEGQGGACINDYFSSAGVNKTVETPAGKRFSGIGLSFPFATPACVNLNQAFAHKFWGRTS